MDSFINYRPEGIYIIEEEGMNLRCIGGLDLYMPRTSEEVRFRMMMEERGFCRNFYLRRFEV
jgi:hypothetical protein